MNRFRIPSRFQHLAEGAYGHFWTIVPHVHGMVTSWSTGPVDRIEVRYTDSRNIDLTAAGYLHRKPGADTLFVLVHGLGGTPDSAYVREASYRLWSMGYSVLRVGLRGAECDQPDFYNAGLTKDVEVLLETPTVQQFNHRFLMGFSLGGHISLTIGTREQSALVDGVVSVCAPLDLLKTQQWIDRPLINLYRNHCLNGLKRTLRAVRSIAEKRNIDVPVHWDSLKSIQTIRDWDAHIVCPRFGFESVDAYYEIVSIGPRLHQLQVPTLIISARRDPMVPISSIEPYLATARGECWILEQGAHVGFPSRVDTTMAEGGRLYSSIAQWCEDQRTSR